MKKIQCILIVGKDPTQGLDYHLLIPNAECPTNFSEKGKKNFVYICIIMDETVIYLLMD